MTRYRLLDAKAYPLARERDPRNRWGTQGIVSQRVFVPRDGGGGPRDPLCGYRPAMTALTDRVLGLDRRRHRIERRDADGLRPAGTVTLAATALTNFELGPAPWHDTAGDHGSGDPGTVTGTGQSAKSTTTVTASGASKCVWVCCPFTNGTGCPTTNQCP